MEAMDLEELEFASDLRDDIGGASQFSTKSGTNGIKGVFVLDVGARKSIKVRS